MPKGQRLWLPPFQAAAAVFPAVLVAGCVSQVDTVTYKDPIFGESKMPVYRSRSLSESIHGEQEPSTYRISATPPSSDGLVSVILHDVPSPGDSGFSWPQRRAMENQVSAYASASKEKLCGIVNPFMFVYSEGEQRPVYVEAQREVRFTIRCAAPKS